MGTKPKYFYVNCAVHSLTQAGFDAVHRLTQAGFEIPLSKFNDT
jgi:hypothetical protein